MGKGTVAVGMSGGVDSSLAAYLLKEQGYNVIGITMKHWGGIEDTKGKTCCTLDDVYDAKRVCDDLGIPHYTINLESEFKNKVIDYFVEEYINGRTPNPCVVCNRNIKMGKFIDFAYSIGADYFATGHYAVVKDGNLYMGNDVKKDQAYFLAQIKKEYLKKLIFPLGGMLKTEVRKLAEEKNIRVYSKRDSQEICFIENDDYKDFLRKMADPSSFRHGNIVDKSGKRLGKHEGIPFYTIGQRKGLGISHTSSLFVVGFDYEKNEIIVGSNEDLMENKLICTGINLLAYDNIKELDGMEVAVKTRSRDTLHIGKIDVLDQDTLEVSFHDNIRAITPGQNAVFYNNEGMVLGSGFIR